MPNHATATIAGHLGQDPKVNQLASGDSVTRFSVATNRKRKDQQSSTGYIDIVTWWNCTCWGRRGEAIAQYLKKGDPILVTGEPCNRPWTDQNGNDRMSLEIEVRDFSFLGRAEGASGASQGQGGGNVASQPASAQACSNAPSRQSSASGGQGATEFDDDIPFSAHARGWEYCA